MNSSAPDDLEPATPTHADARIQPVETASEVSHPDPITGEPGAHPVGVGVGALGAGAAGAILGAIAGPIGAIIGAAVGAVAGGLAGKEVATTNDEAAPEPTDVESELPPSYTSASQVPAAAETASDFNTYQADSPSALVEPQAGQMVYEVSPETSPLGGSILHGDESSASAHKPTQQETEAFFAASDANPIHESELRSPVGRDTPVSAADMPFATPETSFDKTLSGSEVASVESHGQHTGSKDSVYVTAYYKYLDRQYTGRSGDELGDWLEAEKEVSQS